MTARDRVRYHQLHPAKLLVDWITAIIAGSLLWRHQPVAAIAVRFGPSIVVTGVFVSGRLDHALEAISNRLAAHALARQLSTSVNALRFAGLAMSWAGCWWHRVWLLPAGVLVITAGWLFARRRASVPLSYRPVEYLAKYTAPPESARHSGE